MHEPHGLKDRTPCWSRVFSSSPKFAVKSYDSFGIKTLLLTIENVTVIASRMLIVHTKLLFTGIVPFDTVPEDY